MDREIDSYQAQYRNNQTASTATATVHFGNNIEQVSLQPCLFSVTSTVGKSTASSVRSTFPAQYRRERKNQQDATIRCLLLTSVSTFFGHHYVHLQENKDRVTAFGVLLRFCWMWLVAVVGRCLAGCDHQPHPAEPEQHTKCSNKVFVLLKMGIMTSETC